MGRAGETVRLWKGEFQKEVNQLSEQQSGDMGESKQYVGTSFQYDTEASLCPFMNQKIIMAQLQCLVELLSS